MGSISRNMPCECGSGLKVKRCCGGLTPSGVARAHEAVGQRIQTWAFERYRDEMTAALREITDGGGGGLVLADGDLQLVASWALNDRALAVGGTPAQQYARREDLDSREREVAGRIAATRLGLLRVERVMPGRWIELTDLSSGDEVTVVRALSHGVSRAVQPSDVLVARLMNGPPARSLWGPVGLLTQDTARELMELLDDRINSLGIGREPDRVARAMRAASREIAALLAPGLRGVEVSSRAA